MIIDARDLQDGALIESDICIVGAGGAGIAIARELIGKPYTVCLLESGDLEPDEATQSLSDGENIGLPYFPIIETSTRYLGGNINRWESWCRPFDEIDFEQRDWVPYSGWPFPKRELDPYYERAHAICKIGAYNYDVDYWEKKLNDSRYRHIPTSGRDILTKLWQFHRPPLKFGQAYREELASADNVRLYLNSSVIEIETNESNQAIQQLRVALCSGETQAIAKARLFILATGGIEVPRIMLASNKTCSKGIGNEYDLVGRFFQEHVHFNSGLLTVNNMKHYPFMYTPESIDTKYITAGLCPTREFQEREKVLNYSATLLPCTSPLMSTETAQTPIQKIVGLAHDVGYISTKVLNKIQKKSSKFPLHRRILQLRTRSEQEPNPDSRVLLSREKDRLGVNRTKLDWRLTALDKQTMYKVQTAIQKEVAETKFGSLKIEMIQDNTDWPPLPPEGGDFGGGWHHMGTTRMHDDPKQGVVDSDCRVHGLSNLFIAGSSVFPTGGFANPTLTLLALAIRLADHLDRQLS